MSHGPVVMFAAAAAAAAGLALAAAAAAQPGELIIIAPPYVPGKVTTSTVVRYGDLDLTGAPGAQTMLRRIDGAARLVCSPEPRGSFADRADYKTCYKEAEDRAVADLSAPQVTSLYRARG